MNELAAKDTITQADKTDSLKQEVASLKDTVEALTHKLKASEDQTKSLENKLDTLMLLIESLKGRVDIQDQEAVTPENNPDRQKVIFNSKNPKADNLSIRVDRLSIGVDQKSINPDTQTVNADTQTVNPDTQTVNPDTQMVNADTQTINPDTQMNNPDTQMNNPNTQTVNHDLQIVKIPQIQEQNELLSSKAMLPKLRGSSARVVYKKQIKGALNVMKKTSDVSQEEIIQLLDHWTKRPKRSYDYKRRVIVSLDLFDSYLSSNKGMISSELLEKINREKIILSVKKDLLERLNKKDLVKKQIDRLVEEVFYMLKNSSADIQMLKADFKVPRSTLSRDLKIFRQFGWSKTIGHSSTSRYIFTDEAKKFIRELTGGQIP